MFCCDLKECVGMMMVIDCVSVYLIWKKRYSTLLTSLFKIKSSHYRRACCWIVRRRQGGAVIRWLVRNRRLR